MSNQAPQAQSQQSSILIGIGLGLLLGIAVSSFAWLTRESQRDAEWLNDYGEALAAMAANQAIDSILNHDLVSLQVILQDVVSNPRILTATIHDVDSRLLVQAGKNQSQLPAGLTRAFSQAIPLADSDAGYVTLHISSEGKTQTTIRYTIIAVGLGLSVLLGLLLKTSGLVPTREQERDEEETELDQPDTEQIDEVEGEQSFSSMEPPKAVACLTLRFLNRETLLQQLSHQIFRKAVDELEALIVSCAGVYNGGSWSESLTPGVYSLQFPSHDSADEARFRAVCFSALLQKRYQPKKFRLDLSFLIELEGEDCNFILRQPGQIAIYTEQKELEHELSSRIVCQPEQVGICVVDNFPGVVQQQIDAHLSEFEQS